MSNANDKNVQTKNNEFNNIQSNILTSTTADGNMLLTTEGDINLAAAEIKNDAGGIGFGDLGDNYTGVPQTNSSRNMGVMRLYSATNGIVCLDGQCNYYRVNYTTGLVGDANNVVRFPVRSWEATNDQTQQMPYVCDLFILFQNDLDDMNIEAVDNPINQGVITNSMTFKGIENDGAKHEIPVDGVGGLLAGINDCAGVGRSICVINSFNGNTDQKLHLRISSYGSQTDIAQELLVEVIGMGPDGNLAGGRSRFQAHAT